ncbi:MAG: DUF3710 domain-containing protein [Intrasporangiaceae bacterium]|nr:DUF3710 domain-containing protein [Intrasporangiaceae bacterium]
MFDAPVEEALPVRGPKDQGAVAGQDGRLDLGSIWMRGVPGMELRLEVDEPRQKVIAAQLVLGDSQMQVQAFAAPRSAGIWDEIRDEIAQSLATGGGTAEEVEGPLGTELHARMPSKAATGRTVFSPVRFVGIDGPRWFFRAVLSGRAAIDATAAEQFYALLDEIVVVRGEVPMAPREVLALQLPKNTTRAVAEGGEAPDSEDGSAEPAEVDLGPFERGPEITETR